MPSALSLPCAASNLACFGVGEMGERRVLSRFAPPGEGDDFFNAARRRRQPDNQPIKVRMVIPMTLRCDTCGNYIYKRTKLNSRKECCIGEIYSGTQIFRFYFKCTRCSAEITLKTVPQNSGYTAESGATHNLGPWCAKDEINGSSELVLNPSDVLTKTNGPESANKEENKHSTLSITVNPCKKQKTEPTASLDDCEEPVAEEDSVTTIK
ncbi:unnamed protein product [Alopecurus aequalis]